MDIVYCMPQQAGRLFVNVIHACPNACTFCVDFKGDTFFGFDLKSGNSLSSEQIVTAVKGWPYLATVKEIYFCGIGEPLLRYASVIEAATQLREMFSADVTIGINTSGTFYRWNPRVDFARHFDLVQVSLNAESAEKYDQICRPKFRGAYSVLMRFLAHLRQFLNEGHSSCRVELSVVDTSDSEYLPVREQGGSTVPTPDIQACEKIAESFGWPLKVKRLMRDYEDTRWVGFAEEVRSQALVQAKPLLATSATQSFS